MLWPVSRIRTRGRPAVHHLRHRGPAALLLLLVSGLLGGCGQKGDLYLPEETALRAPAPTALTQVADHPA
ncbi:MAG: hypothetical protein D6786_02170 [Gammaproteobacteria bacterium]|nr:MAG: hypothetical protein D6786_02170 [Gammaproteobacteria bacterium]